MSWIHNDGRTRTDNYIIPNANQCKGCHKAGEIMRPIGPKARNLNRDFAYSGGTENQLTHWARRGALAGAPEPAAAPRLAAWDDPRSGTLDAAPVPGSKSTALIATAPRARLAIRVSISWPRNETRRLSASTSLRWPPASARAAWLSTSSRGRPDQSILAFRIASTHPGIMMPELGKRLVHEEGVALIREWIAAMPVASPKSREAGDG